MAKSDVTLRAIEKHVRQLESMVKNLRDMCAIAETHGMPSIPLDFGTFEFYSNWMHKWTEKNVGTVDAAIVARSTQWRLTAGRGPKAKKPRFRLNKID